MHKRNENKMKIDEIMELEPGKGGLHQLLGVQEVFYDAENRVCVNMEITPHLLNPYGKVHGGSIAALCDIAMGCYQHLHGRRAVALECSVAYYRPGEADTVLTATVSERKVGRRISHFLVKVTDNHGRHIADGTCSSYQTE